MLTAIAALVLLVGGMAWAQESLREADLPVFGVGAGQIFRFSVAAVQDSSRVGSAAARCQASLSFRDAENRPIGPRRDVDLGPNESAFLDLDPRAFGLKTRQRISFRPVASLRTESGPCQVSFSVLDALTGRVGAYGGIFDLLAIGVDVGACPELDQPGEHLLPPFGAGQTLQVPWYVRPSRLASTMSRSRATAP